MIPTSTPHNAPPDDLSLAQAAKWLGIKRPYLYGMLYALDIHPHYGPPGKPGKRALLLSWGELEEMRNALASYRRRA